MRKPKPGSWLANLNRLPPQFCRLVARKRQGRLPMSNSDLAAVSGLSRSTINKLAHARNWNHVTAETIQRFSLACGVNLLHQSEAIHFFRRSRLAYIRNASPSQKKLYDRLMRVNSPAKAGRQNET